MLMHNDHSSGVNQHPFTLFLDLVALDQKIRAIHDETQTLKTGIDEHVDQKKAMVERFERFKQQVSELKKSIDAHDLEMRSLEERERVKRAQLEQASNIKEYQPLKKEIDTLKRAQYEQERSLISLWNKMESAQKELDAQHETCNNKIQEHHDAIASNQDRIELLRQQLELLMKERPAREAGVPSEWLDKYVHMRMQVADPVVAVMQDSCGACFYSIAGQELMRLRRRAIVQCKGCFRLLYMKEAMQEMPEACDKA